MSAGPTALKLETRSRSAAAARAGLTSLALLSVTHFVIDMYSSALGALQPLLVDDLDLSLAQAGVLGGCLVFSSSVMQPVYGYLSDRFRTPMFTALAPAVAGVFIASLGLAPSYGWLIAMVVLGGAGVASFHPQASSFVAAAGAMKRGSWMAIFVSTGTLGMAVGPAYFSAITTRLGLGRTYWAALPGILTMLLLVCLLRGGSAAAMHKRLPFDWAPLKSVWRPLTLLYFLVFIRSIVQITFAQFLPLYLHRERGFSLAAASYALSLYLASGAVGGFIGGHLSDRLGGRTVILLSMIGCVPFLALFFFGSGAAALIGLALGGLMLLFTIPVNVVMAQGLAPSQAGTVSALMMGFAWGAAGIIFIPLSGWASDIFSLHAVLASLAAFPLMGFFLALKLPK